MGEKKYTNDLEILTKFEALGYAKMSFINGRIFITRKCDKSEAPRIECVIVINYHNKTYYKYAEFEHKGSFISSHLSEGITTQEHKILHEFVEYMGWLDVKEN